MTPVLEDGEAAEALLELAVGGKPPSLQPEPSIQPGMEVPSAQEEGEAGLESVEAAAFNHPDAQRRFRVIGSTEELERALNFPWEKWTIFLHPAQRDLVERDYSGPARVSGSAGTGKTIVALHRAAHLARTHPHARVLLTTFSETLANALRTRLRRLIGNEPQLGERIEVYAIGTIGRRLYEPQFGPPKFAPRDLIQDLLGDAAQGADGQRFSLHFLLTEWEQIVDPWRLESWESYRDVRRLGRKTRLPEPQRAQLWRVFDAVRGQLADRGLVTEAGMFHRLADQLATRKNPPFDFAVVDEAQDVAVAQLRFLAALGGDRPNSLFFAGDLGQRIFQTPFSWRSLGVDVRGRSRTLRINYRTSHQIRMQADRLLGPELSDVDGNIEERYGTISVFNGPLPTIQIYDEQIDEIAAVGAWIASLRDQGVQPDEIGVFARSSTELNRARQATESANVPYKVLDDGAEPTTGLASVSTMHLAKGMEFRAVVVMACDDEVVPLQGRIESVSDESDLEEVYNTERHLLYVACTRARDQLLVTATDPASEFLDDLRV